MINESRAVHAVNWGVGVESDTKGVGLTLGDNWTILSVDQVDDLISMLQAAKARVSGREVPKGIGPELFQNPIISMRECLECAQHNTRAFSFWNFRTAPGKWECSACDRRKAASQQ